MEERSSGALVAVAVDNCWLAVRDALYLGELLKVEVVLVDVDGVVKNAVPLVVDTDAPDVTGTRVLAVVVVVDEEVVAVVVVVVVVVG